MKYYIAYVTVLGSLFFNAGLALSQGLEHRWVPWPADMVGETEFRLETTHRGDNTELHATDSGIRIMRETFTHPRTVARHFLVFQLDEAVYFKLKSPEPLNAEPKDKRIWQANSPNLNQDQTENRDAFMRNLLEAELWVEGEKLASGPLSLIRYRGENGNLFSFDRSLTSTKTLGYEYQVYWDTNKLMHVDLTYQQLSRYVESGSHIPVPIYVQTVSPLHLTVTIDGKSLTFTPDLKLWAEAGTGE